MKRIPRNQAVETTLGRAANAAIETVYRQTGYELEVAVLEANGLDIGEKKLFSKVRCGNDGAFL